MARAKLGDRVRIDYSGTLADGTVFDTTLESSGCDCDDCDTGEHDAGDCGCGCETGPIELTIGTGEIFPQIDEALAGMACGEKRVLVIPAAEAFGEYDPEKVFTVPRADLPEGLAPSVGEELVLVNEDDEELGVLVVEVSDDSVTFDANHPLAGEDVTYELHLVEIL